MPTIESNGETLFYTQTGDGPAVVLLHAVGARAALWSETAAHFGDDRRIYAFDLRGHGDSSLNGSLEVTDMTADLVGALEALGVDRFHLVGVSLGAGIAVHLAASVGSAVESLSVAGIGLVPDQVLEDEVYGIREAAHYLAEEDFAEQIGEALLMPEAPAAGIEGIRAGVASLGKRNYLAGLEAMLATDLTGVAPNVTAPSLVLHGELDELVSEEQARALADALPEGTLQILENTGHVAHLDNPNALGEAIAKFLGSHAS